MDSSPHRLSGSSAVPLRPVIAGVTAVPHLARSNTRNTNRSADAAGDSTFMTGIDTERVQDAVVPDELSAGLPNGRVPGRMGRQACKVPTQPKCVGMLSLAEMQNPGAGFRRNVLGYYRGWF